MCSWIFRATQASELDLSTQVWKPQFIAGGSGDKESHLGHSRSTWSGALETVPSPLLDPRLSPSRQCQQRVETENAKLVFTAQSTVFSAGDELGTRSDLCWGGAVGKVRFDFPGFLFLHTIIHITTACARVAGFIHELQSAL